MSDALPPPYGVPGSGEPVATPGELLAGFAQGTRGDATAGSWRIEGELLTGRDTPIAIRLHGAALLRHDLSGDMGELHRACAAALAQAGMRCIEACTVLGHVVGIETAGLRDADWDLWAPDADTGHTALQTRALGEMAERIDPHEPTRRNREAETLAEIERDLWS